MKKAFAKFVAMSIFLGIISGGTAGAVGFGRFGRGNCEQNDSIVEARVNSEICKEKTKELREETKVLDERLTKLEKEVSVHKEKDYHGYGLKSGGWWKNVVSRLQSGLVLYPLKWATISGLVVYLVNKYGKREPALEPSV